MNWFVYFLKCSDDSIYIGITNNLKKRIHSHNNSKCGAKYTKSRRPVFLLVTIKCEDKIQAAKLEFKLKKMNHFQKLKLVKNALLDVAEETKIILKQKYYCVNGKKIDISKNIDNCINNSKFYSSPLNNKAQTSIKPVVEITNETTSSAIVRLLNSGKDNVVALNFASANTPGGGWLNGAKAQEEDLTRCSTLYASLSHKPDYYNANILCNNNYYTDGIIYSPDVLFFRNDELMLIEDNFISSIITAPAPCLRNVKEVDIQNLRNIILNRAIKILQIAMENKHKTIILGAWGCGAFGNDPDIVSSVFYDALKVVPYFEHVCFAIYDMREGQPLISSFRKTFDE
jgi:uncharacterized protein (TIGR02452 family)